MRKKKDFPYLFMVHDRFSFVCSEIGYTDTQAHTRTHTRTQNKRYHNYGLQEPNKKKINRERKTR